MQKKIISLRGGLIGILVAEQPAGKLNISINQRS
jgi:hypothetical protein